eukprot:TRINITY_DN9061_c0_g1_i2.p1 TRINITY_DN9061_c0_g1~~TRINITY_DN9061_c0_g1_i2.p1  ORF type:complete len:227 (+),score=60.25 TRINITY_DN9061_c0_g1_i2:26-682(+)
MAQARRRLCLFDVDGTLTPARLEASPEMHTLLKELRQRAYIGVVGGSDLPKIKEQLGNTVVADFDYVFAENGCVAYADGKELPSTSVSEYLGEERLRKFINFVLHYIADLDIPIKRGTFIEFRRGMLNVSPIGRNCSYEERVQFEKDDKVHQYRSTMVNVLRARFPDLPLQYSIGGMISFDVFPIGWNKTLCLKHLTGLDVDEILFFGDKTDPVRPLR